MSAVHNVIRVRIERAADGSHRHLTGVWVQESDAGPPYTPKQVAESIREGETWHAEVDGVAVQVEPTASCPYPGCDMHPCLAILDRDGRDLLEHVASASSERNIY
jgi:hypothetical protein